MNAIRLFYEKIKKEIKVNILKQDYKSAIKLYQLLIEQYPRKRIEIYKELYLCYFYNRDYLLMVKIRQELFVLELQRKIGYRRKIWEQNINKIIVWFEKKGLQISRKQLELIELSLIGVGSVVLYWGFYLLQGLKLF